MHDITLTDSEEDPSNDAVEEIDETAGTEEVSEATISNDSQATQDTQE